MNFSPDGESNSSASEASTIRLRRASYWRWWEVCCDRLRYHIAFIESNL
ncbi:hypothetical protein [Nostoc punctiforme]|nr:hypothetical protein [Nostoc punctiforme]